MTAIFRTTLAVSFALLLASCGMKEAMDKADTEIAEFHGHFDREEYDAIWKTTSGEFRKATSKQDFERLLVAIHTKLGTVKESSQQGWQANTNNGVSTVVIGMKSTFERGEGAETFTYIRDGEDLKLLGYNINSAALIYN